MFFGAMIRPRAWLQFIPNRVEQFMGPSADAHLLELSAYLFGGRPTDQDNRPARE